MKSFLRKFFGAIFIAACVVGLVWNFMARWDNAIKNEPEMEPITANQICFATYFSWPEHGNKGAFGEVIDSLAMICAVDTALHLKHNDMIRVANVETGASVDVRVADNMSPKLCKERPDVDIDLSAGAFKKIGNKRHGKIAVVWKKL